jgi:DNA-binding XRE family transcriptional regulator
MSRQKQSSRKNNVKSLREELLISKAELARRAGISPLTVGRIEGGADCRMDTKRKIILALGKRVEEKRDVFPGIGFQEKNAPVQDDE